MKTNFLIKTLIISFLLTIPHICWADQGIVALGNAITTFFILLILFIISLVSLILFYMKRLKSKNSIYSVPIYILLSFQLSIVGYPLILYVKNSLDEIMTSNIREVLNDAGLIIFWCLVILFLIILLLIILYALKDMALRKKT
jgi:hypothetical protein